jgi:hypothetical protein
MKRKGGRYRREFGPKGLKEMFSIFYTWILGERATSKHPQDKNQITHASILHGAQDYCKFSLRED